MFSLIIFLDCVDAEVVLGQMSKWMQFQSVEYQALNGFLVNLILMCLLAVPPPEFGPLYM